jgi:ribosomal RNA-processing protein 36
MRAAMKNPAYGFLFNSNQTSIVNMIKSEEEEATDDEVEAKKLQSRVSFGTLAKAQNTLTGNNGADRKRKRGSEGDAEAEAKLDALRARLRELKEKGTTKKVDASAGFDSGKKSKTISMKDAKGTISNSEEEEDDSSEEEEEEEDGEPTKKKARSSKHAPTSLSSKRAVTRRRTAVPMAKSTVRDPRFDPLSGPVDYTAVAKKYSFLDTYRDSEISTLKKAMKNPKLPAHEKETLKRQVVSMESKMAFEKSKEREAKVVREHRKEEKKRVEEGKTPFYIKKSKVREEALKERFEGMKGRQRDKVIERRRKKLTAKERRGMPEERRG